MRQRIEAANAPRSLALAEGALWVVSGAEGDRPPRRPRPRRTRARAIPVGVKATRDRRRRGALWVASEETGTVTRLDPRTGAIVDPVNVGNAPSALAVGEGAVWVVNRTDGTRVADRPRHELGLDGASASAATRPRSRSGEGAVWVAGGEDGTVARVDPDGPRKAQRFKTGSSPSALAVAGGSVWTAAVAPRPRTEVERCGWTSR